LKSRLSSLARSSGSRQPQNTRVRARSSQNNSRAEGYTSACAPQRLTQVTDFLHRHHGRGACGGNTLNGIQVRACGKLLEVSRPSRSGMTGKSVKVSSTIQMVRSHDGLACTRTTDGSLRSRPGGTTGPGTRWSIPTMLADASRWRNTLGRTARGGKRKHAVRRRRAQDDTDLRVARPH
jgi:hypothetical protein